MQAAHSLVSMGAWCSGALMLTVSKNGAILLLAQLSADDYRGMMLLAESSC
jgi:hypothetical protein